MVVVPLRANTLLAGINTEALALASSEYLSKGITIFNPSFPPFICITTKILPQLAVGSPNACKKGCSAPSPAKTGMPLSIKGTEKRAVLPKNFLRFIIVLYKDYIN